MRVFKNKWFTRFARKSVINDRLLFSTVDDIESGLVDADLGAGVFKQRLARQGEGKSGGFRTFVIFRSGDRAIFIYAFGKNDRANIREDELQGFQELATAMLGYSDDELTAFVELGVLIEIERDEQDIQE